MKKWKLDSYMERGKMAVVAVDIETEELVAFLCVIDGECVVTVASDPEGTLEMRGYESTASEEEQRA
jgi:hypothetical protein